MTYITQSQILDLAIWHLDVQSQFSDIEDEQAYNEVVELHNELADSLAETLEAMFIHSGWTVLSFDSDASGELTTDEQEQHAWIIQAGWDAWVKVGSHGEQAATLQKLVEQAASA